MTTFQNTSKFVSAARRIFNSLFHASKSGQTPFLVFDTIHEQHYWTFKLKWRPNQSQNNRASLQKDITYFSGEKKKLPACDKNNTVTILSINCRTLYYKFPSNEVNTALSDLADEQTLLSVLGAKHFRPFSSLSVMQNHLIGLTTTTKKWNWANAEGLKIYD